MFIRPRYMVWENVPGAFSSNKGKDFATVLEETVRVTEPNAPAVPVPAGGWPRSGCLYDEMGRWSVAWRVHDAQFWGVPQRRKRIALVADFGGMSAPEIQFERKGLCWYSAERESPRKETPGDNGSGTYPAIARTLTARNDGSPCIDRGPDIVVQAIHQNQNGELRCGEVANTLSTNGNASGRNAPLILCIQGNIIDRDAKMNGSGIAPEPMFTLNTVDRHAVFDARGNGNGVTVPTLTGDHENRITDYTAIVYEFKSFGEYQVTETGKSLLRSDDITTGDIVIPFGYQELVARRLTPLECDRLQGYPDNWTDIGEWTDSKGKKHNTSDSSRYKAIGNSIALPYWFWLLRRISAQYERPATSGSLFDGIGGFPLCWERCNGKGTSLWASEIEEFPIAVTKYHFPDAE